MKQLIIAIVIIALAILHYYIGTPITLFLSVTVTACLAYYLLQLQSERSIGNALQKGNTDGTIFLQFIKDLRHKQYLLLSTSLLLVVFLSSMICLKKVLNPSTKNAWFKNTDYHAIRHLGIQFKQALNINAANYTDSTNSNFTFSIHNQSYNVRTNNFYEPVLQEVDKGKYKCINNIYNQTFTDACEIKNSSYSLQINTKSISTINWAKPWNKKLFTTYSFTVTCKDATLLRELGLNTNYSDTFSFTDKALTKGLSLQDLLSDRNHNKIINAHTAQIIQNLLLEVGEAYLLVNNTSEQAKNYVLFPSKEMIDNNYSLTANGITNYAKVINDYPLERNKDFQIGLSSNTKLQLDTINGQSALVFDMPKSYLLQGAQEAVLGKKNNKYITNNISELLNNNSKEAFLFDQYLLAEDQSISGILEYNTGLSENVFEGNIIDNNTQKMSKLQAGQQFNLSSADGSIKYLLDVKDFSQNGFNYRNILLYCSFLFLAFLALQIFAPGKKLERIEPIILACIYALVTLRFILYWRIATFPPLENISKHELESTLLGFDFHLFGMQFPVPLTLVFISIILMGIVLHRKFNWQKYRPKISLHKYLNKYNWQKTHRTLAIYLAILLVCFVVFAFIPIEFTKRISSILIPIIAYQFFSWKVAETYTVHALEVQSIKWHFLKYFKSLLHYFINNPTFYLTLSTIIFFALVDRGFCIVFILFILLKNIILNFYKKSFGSTKIKLWEMFLNPKNYWIYAILSLFIYLILLSAKSLFYYLLTYKLIVLLVVCVLAWLIVHLFYKQHTKSNMAFGIITLALIINLCIPAANTWLDKKITDKIKHVQYRASIIHQPINDLLSQNAYSSFNTRKIIETAQNQWFINSYITKPFDNTKPINLQSFSKIGVNYNTQTRDVVLARFVIAEFGGLAMALILALFILPLLIYLLSYKLKNTDATPIFIPDSYAALTPLLLLFTISLFVWLTATNRFVFFGQDFPFLSLTSRLSVLLPMLLYAIVLTRKPQAYNAMALNIPLGASRYALLFIAIVVFGYATFSKNNLSDTNFNVVVASAKNNIEHPFNNILNQVQDSLQAKGVKINYDKLCRLVKKHSSYLAFKKDISTDVYTNSILTNWEKNNASAMLVNNPLYMRYENGRYLAEYNSTLYLAKPVTENKMVWHGNIVGQNTLATETIDLQYGKYNNKLSLPAYVNDASTNGLDMAFLPATWLANKGQAIGLINVQNQYKKSTKILIQKTETNNLIQQAQNYVHAIEIGEQVAVQNKRNKFNILLSANNPIFAKHQWVNNAYKTIYPLREKYFYPYNFCNTIRSAFNQEPNYTTALTLDYALLQNVQSQINATYANGAKSKRTNFAVIAADGNGNIRLMNDYNATRKWIDPNNSMALATLQTKHFFYSNAKNERDQWGNANLLQLYLGPGSSIKPLILANLASQVNAGWQYLKYIPANREDKNNYAGMPLALPWKSDEHSFPAQMDIPTYIEQSSNFFHSIMLFLGSYSKRSFGDSTYSITNILESKPNNKNVFPKVAYLDKQYYLPSFNKGKNNWPYSDASHTIPSYFANENSILANALNINANLATNDKDKQDGSAGSVTPRYFIDSTIYQKLLSKNTAQFLWSFPEASQFLQSMRHYVSNKKKNELNENFNLGLKATTLGGYPYQITPFKMLEMYNALFTFNRNYNMHITPKLISKKDWQVDSSWKMQEYRTFLAENIFTGMQRVITNGTGKQLQNIKNKYPQYYFYAKTGTINEAGYKQLNSRRLVVCVTNKDLSKAENIGNAKVFSFYFTIDNNKDFDWNLLNNIINSSLQSATCKNYFEQND